MSESMNPCATCCRQQDCCARLSGLRVTAVEFERCFAQHADQLHVAREGPIYVLTPRSGTCPNWRDGGCAVYEDRPRECRLFPFTLFVREPSGAGPVSLGFHCDTRCPLKSQLALPEPEVVQLVREFGREAFGEHVAVGRESWRERWKRRAWAMVESLWARWTTGVAAEEFPKRRRVPERTATVTPFDS